MNEGADSRMSGKQGLEVGSSFHVRQRISGAR